MNAILLESVLFIALIAVAGALFVTALRTTSIGNRFRQIGNRKRIDHMVDLTCPVHGLQRESELVRLSTGETICPSCYQEAANGHVD